MKMKVVGSSRATMNLNPLHLALGKVPKTKVAGDLFYKSLPSFWSPCLGLLMHTPRLSWASKMTEQARVLVTKPNDMSSNPKTHIAERTDFHTLSFDLHKHALACEYLARCMRTQRMNT